MTTAEEWKAKGNQALQAKNTTEAIEMYTKAINEDGANHVYFSNRSAAYLQKGDATNALEDANSCIGLNPDFPKGYSRKGAALHALTRFNDSIAAYKAGLEKFPDDKGLTQGLVAVKRQKEGPPRGMPGGGRGMGPGGANPMAGLFGPQMMAQIAMDPKLREYLKDDDFVAKLQSLEKDPSTLTTMLGDPRMMEVFKAVLGAKGMDLRPPEGMGGGAEPKDDREPQAPPSAAKDDEAKPEPMEEEEPMEVEDDISAADRKKKEQAEASLKSKEKGNELFKSKKFEDALAAYDEAIAQDPTNMTFISNKAAVYFNTKRYDECIEACKEAVEVGKANRAPFEDRAKALTRAAKAYQKKDDLAMAIVMCREAQLESYEKATERLLKTMELEKRKSDTLAYQDDEKADEAKQKGNTHFRNKEWVEAVKSYEEAVKRSPHDAPIRNNLAAALCKIMDFNGAKKNIETALDIDPKYVKAWARKGDIEIVMKENHKAMDSYKKGLAIDPTSTTCKEGLRKVMSLISAGSANMTEAEKREMADHAMADPEIQSILQDPIVQQVLRDFNENPDAAQQAMRDPYMRGKIEKLIASGIVQTG